jgi:hypothetical protein
LRGQSARGPERLTFTATREAIYLFAFPVVVIVCCVVADRVIRNIRIKSVCRPWNGNRGEDAAEWAGGGMAGRARLGLRIAGEGSGSQVDVPKVRPCGSDRIPQTPVLCLPRRPLDKLWLRSAGTAAAAAHRKPSVVNS